ncbi:hypothetical protein [Mycolicibacterium tokaiense]|uniref:hypothetical protein n=1 Tax=Mycolicibacterium tokaiense TaxID=39695 RepID=UPI0015592766|nr:hypothetical protein [Mycolicibacterium tokaiense]
MFDTLPDPVTYGDLTPRSWLLPSGSTAQRITTEREHNALLRALDHGPPTRSPFI